MPHKLLQTVEMQHTHNIWLVLAMSVQINKYE